MKGGMKLFAVVMLLLLVPVGALAEQFEDQEIPRTRLRAAIRAQGRHSNSVMLDPNVVGTAVGVGANGREVVKIFVKNARIGRHPAALDGIPVEVEETGEIFALRKTPEAVTPRVDRTARFPRPVPIGISTGHPDITAGTIAARVKDGTNVFALSNNHVYADMNSANIDDNVLQPGPFDGGVDPD
ncbi:MAG: hypothetical protein HY713_00565, partial [candidate division NC10 bacterium]|nr:hypothetical protein [candidate division NC10 bacterium]